MHEQSLPRVLKLVTPLSYEAVALGQPIRKICCTNPHISYWHDFSVAELPVDSIALSTFYLLTLHPVPLLVCLMHRDAWIIMCSFQPVLFSPVLLNNAHKMNRNNL